LSNLSPEPLIERRGLVHAPHRRASRRVGAGKGLRARGGCNFKLVSLKFIGGEKRLIRVNGGLLAHHLLSASKFRLNDNELRTKCRREQKRIGQKHHPASPCIIQMSKTHQVRIQGYIADKLLNLYGKTPFAPSLTQLVNRELAAALDAKPKSKRGTKPAN